MRGPAGAGGSASGTRRLGSAASTATVHCQLFYCATVVLTLYVHILRAVGGSFPQVWVLRHASNGPNGTILRPVTSVGGRTRYRMESGGEGIPVRVSRECGRS
jgi:hypothetical protein